MSERRSAPPPPPEAPEAHEAHEDERDSIPIPLSRRSLVLALDETVPTAPPPPVAAPRGVEPRPGSVRSAAGTAVRSRLGASGLLLATMLLMVAIFADLLASDLPIACSVHGSTYVLPAVTHPAPLVTMSPEAIRKEASWSVFPLVAHGPARVDDAPLLRPGHAGHPLCTDHEGHDVFARVIHGTRGTIIFALLAVAASLFLGALMGGLAGLFGGTTDAIVARGIETISAFPPLVLVLGIQAAVPRPTLATLFFAIALTRWPEAARLVRAEVLLATTRDYVLAARALGASPLRILRKHVAPNVRGPLIVASAVGIATVILTEASLDFLRVGVPAGASSWGETMSQFRDAPTAWWLLAFPGVFLVAAVIGHNLAGEAFREAFDPRAR